MVRTPGDVKAAFGARQADESAVETRDRRVSPFIIEITLVMSCFPALPFLNARK